MDTENTKNAILTHLRSLTGTFTFENANLLTAAEISKAFYISRSLASQYLNEMVKEKILLKVNSRPVYFFHIVALKQRFGLQKLEDEYYSLEELKKYIGIYGKTGQIPGQLVGFDKSLSDVISHLREGMEYPPFGLPVLLTGPDGAGKQTIARAVAEDSLRQRGLESEIRIRSINAARKDFDEIVFGASGLLTAGQPGILIIGDAQKLTARQLDEFSDRLDPTTRTDGGKAEMVFLTVSGEDRLFLERLSKYIPIMIQVPGFRERSYDEREELVMHFLKEEMLGLGRDIFINSVTLRTLIKSDYPGNIRELRNIIKQMCAKMIASVPEGTDIILESKSLPEEQLRSLQISAGEQQTYIHAGSYLSNETTGLLLEYFGNILESFCSGLPLENQRQEAARLVEKLTRDLLYRQQVESVHLQGIEESLANIIDVVMYRRSMSVPAEFRFMASKLFYYCDKYPKNIDKWQKANEAEIGRINRQLFENYLDEGMITNEIVEMVRKNLGIQAYDILLTVLLIALSQYRQQFGSRKYIGLIICHGLSTASSIADAANSLLNSYVYDAIDMPLNIDPNEVAQRIVDRLNMLNSQADAIILVDMGSMERLGEILGKRINRRIGVINNVTTRTAIQIGYEILNAADMEHIMKEAMQGIRQEYTIVERRVNSRILFVSESGLQTAKRMRDLFRDSLPGDIPVDCEVCDFRQLAVRGKEHEIFSEGQVLFISGTSNPGIQGVPFIALEEFIDSSGAGVIEETLRRYLQPEQMERLVQTLRNKFTLNNIVGHLTILNPQNLLENVTYSVERLQHGMGRKFQGRTLVGIYIHICCLVERMVTKNPIQDNQDMESFAADHKDFIRLVKESFTNIIAHYGVEIPLNEISYLYDFIVADAAKQAETREDDELEGD